jgi:hypothetical protein
LVWQLVIKETGAAPVRNKTQFPIFLDPTGYKDRGEPVLVGVGTKAKALIKSLQPFATGEGGASPLWHLHELSNWDKHRTITAAAAAAEAISIQAVAGEVAGLMVMQTRKPLKDDTVLCSARLKPSATPFMDRIASVKMEGNFTYYIAFEQPAVAVDKPVVSVLGACGGRLNEIMKRVHKEIFA